MTVESGKQEVQVLPHTPIKRKRERTAAAAFHLPKRAVASRKSRTRSLNLLLACLIALLIGSVTLLMGVVVQTENQQAKGNSGLSAESITEFLLPTPHSPPNAITAGPNDTLWFTESNSNQIGRLLL